MRIIWGTITLVLLSYAVVAQSRLAVFDVEIPNSEKSYLSEVSSHIVSLYANDDRFVVIDKANSQLIKDEQDRQKNEEFIDGYIAQQGVQEGFDYCYYSKYLSSEKKLAISLYDVAKGTAIASKSIPVKITLLGRPKGLFAKVDAVIADINTSVFEVRFEVLRMTEDKKNKAKTLLVAVGYNQNAKEDQEYEIYQMVEEKVGGKVLERKNVIGEGSIKEVEDGNFSQLKVSKGNAEIYQLLQGGQSLFLQHKND